jgi:hypothetical protein
MRFRLFALTVALGTLAGALACSAEAPAPAANAASAPAAQSATPATAPLGGTPATAPQSAAASTTAGEPSSVADIFPAGPGRDTVLNNCASCHNLACSAIGQRPPARWDSLQESHKDKIPDADARAAFSYLKSHFNDANPEPKVPPKFLQGGCTPF